MSGLTDAELVEELCEIEDGFSEWEVEFVESIAKWMEDHDSLTDGQRQKADQIYHDKAE